MKKWFVIADDLTGAAEMAGIAYESGSSVKLITGGPWEGIGTEDVVVVNANTRNLGADQAAEQVRNIILKSGNREDRRLFLKTDSMLRGNAASELPAALAVTSYTCCLLVPANPSKGRIIRDGKYYVNNTLLAETEYRDDPEHPRILSGISEMLSIGKRQLDTIHIDWDRPDGKILVPDITSVDEIRLLISGHYTPEMLPAGGADLFRELLRSDQSERTPSARPVPRYPITKCIVSGSQASVNRNIPGELLRNKYSLYEIVRSQEKPRSRHGKVSHAYLNQPGKKEMQLLPLGDDAYVASVTLESGKQDAVNVGFDGYRYFLPLEQGSRIALKLQDSNIKKEKDREMMLEKLVMIAAGTAENAICPVHFLVTGGKTANLFCAQLNWSRLVVVDSPGDGTTTLRSVESEHLLTMKPGSYKWPDFLMK